jgi:hypothetical protein
MRKRFFGLTLSTMLFAVSLPAQAQQPGKIPRIGILVSGSDLSHKKWIDIFRQGLRELGYSEGKSIFHRVPIRRGEVRASARSCGRPGPP